MTGQIIGEMSFARGFCKFFFLFLQFFSHMELNNLLHSSHHEGFNLEPVGKDLMGLDFAALNNLAKAGGASRASGSASG